jgi:redox-sensing transcriptional repressor
MVNNPKVPVPTLERLSIYLRFLHALKEADVQTVSSSDIATKTGIDAAQFRKDISYFGEFGKPGVGYNVIELQSRIAAILKIDRIQPLLLVGAGNLGAALINYPGLFENNYEVVGVFDNNIAKIGRQIWDIEIRDVAELEEANHKLKAHIAIIAVPTRAAQDVADCLIRAGVKALLNFAPTYIRVPKNVSVRNVSFLQELAVLSYDLATDEEGKVSEK